nr:restriction endonuclease subunit S [Clostridium paraputrificum]
MALEEKLEEAIVKDAPYELPSNWNNISFGSVMSIEGGTQPPKSQFLFEPTEGYIRLYQIRDFSSENFHTYVKDEKKLRIMSDEDIMIARYGASIGKIFRGRKGAYNVALAKLIYPKELYDVNFLYWFLKSDLFQNNLGDMSRTAVAGFNKNDLKNFIVPLPPLKEQQRIVDKIESLFEKLDKAKELIEESREEFEKRKASILEKAFRGELTREWRRNNRILENKIMEKISEFYSDKLSKKDYKILNELQRKGIDYETVKDSNWIKCSIGAIGKVSNGSTPSRQNEEFWNGSIPWVSSGEVRNNRINCTKECITEEGFNNSSVKLINKGSVLMAMIGEGKTRGQSSILDIDATTNQNIAAIDLSHREIVSEFLWYWLQYNYKRNRDGGNGTGPKALNCQKVRDLDFILPPKKEQREIVKILDDLLGNESKIEELTSLEEQIKLIKKSILAKAFRGKLGTNCEDDESDLKLLKEILSKK